MARKGNEAAAAAARRNEKSPEKRGSSRHVTVDDRRAEILVEDFPEFSVVEVRTALEFEPVRMAIGMLQWARGKPNPAKALVGWARKRRRGYYRPASRRPDAGAEYRRYLEHIRRKEAESLELLGRGLSPAEAEDAARLWYAPAHRAAMDAVPEAAWREPGSEEDEVA